MSGKDPKTYFKPPPLAPKKCAISAFERRRQRHLDKTSRLKSILESLLDIPIENLTWPELKEYQDIDCNLTLEEVMHMAQIKRAVKGETTAYKALLERAKGKIPTKSIAVSTDYKSFLENALKQEKQVNGSDIDIPPNATVTITETYESDDDEPQYEDLDDL